MNVSALKALKDKVTDEDLDKYSEELQVSIIFLIRSKIEICKNPLVSNYCFAHISASIHNSLKFKFVLKFKKCLKLIQEGGSAFSK